MKKTTVRRLLGGLAVLWLGTSLASASSITWYNNIFYTPDSPTGASNSPLGVPTQYTVPFSTTVSIPKFDQTILGDPNHYNHLTSVQIALSWISSGTVSVLNNSTVAHSFTNATSAAGLSIIGPDSTTVNATAQAGPASGTVPAGTFIPPPGPGGLCPLGCVIAGSYSTSLPSASGSSNNTVIGAGLASYEQFNAGAFTIPFSFTAASANFGGTETGGSGHLFFGGSADVGASIQVTYNYDVVTVPEPGTFLMLGSALVGVGLFIRRRRA